MHSFLPLFAGCSVKTAPPSPKEDCVKVKTLWQPIETAPKGDDPRELNGPPIIGWCSTWPTGYEIFWYASDQAWYLANMDSEYGSPEYPTHWMPLPEPPESA
jgi:hypothetical protein